MAGGPPGAAHVDAEGGLPAVLIRAPSGDTAVVHLHGATLTSAVLAGRERLFVSSRAVFDGSKPIRGGIPICAPQFGMPKEGAYEGMARHGFCRSSRWSFQDASVDGGVATATFSLLPADLSEEVRGVFPFDFAFSYRVTVGNGQLRCDLTCSNRGEEPFRYQALLYDYFGVADATRCRVLGLRGSLYYDKTIDTHDLVEAGEAVVVPHGEVDRVYKSGAALCIVEPAEGPSAVHVVTLERSALVTDALGAETPLRTDTEVWNPWASKAAGMGDMGDDDYRGFVCVEPGVCTTWATVPAGGSTALSQVIRAW